MPHKRVTLFQISFFSEICVYYSRGGGTWENATDKWDRLKSHRIANFIQSIRQFILRVKSNMSTVFNHKDKLHIVDKLHTAKSSFSIEVYKQQPGVLIMSSKLTAIYYTWEENRSTLQEKFLLLKN